MRQVVRRLLGRLLLSGMGGALLGALLGLIVSDLLVWWDRGVVIAGAIFLGALLGTGAGLIEEDAASIENDG